MFSKGDIRRFGFECCLKIAVYDWVYLTGLPLNITGKPEHVCCTTVQICSLLTSSLPNWCNCVGKSVRNTVPYAMYGVWPYG